MGLTFYNKINFDDKNAVQTSDITLLINEWGRKNGVRVNRHNAINFINLFNYCAGIQKREQDMIDASIIINEEYDKMFGKIDGLECKKYELAAPEIRFTFDGYNASVAITDIEFMFNDPEGRLEFLKMINTCDLFEVKAINTDKGVTIIFGVNNVWKE